ncbi:unnamed protein product [Cylicocyclus nassatus]|uniref:Uncharacterized protein n=1 Tax=Cylicocyclus nassatus TaxID=53992 RepID=A0AA36GRE7_CYLNA|nr:unnamed protein product [Cylicocyclus nassatus]
MDLPTSSTSRSTNFSTIARRLLLERQHRESSGRSLPSHLSSARTGNRADEAAIHALDILSGNTSSANSEKARKELLEESLLFLSQTTSDKKESLDEIPQATSEEKETLDEMDAADLLSDDGSLESLDSLPEGSSVSPPASPSEPGIVKTEKTSPHSSSSREMDNSVVRKRLIAGRRGDPKRLGERLQALRPEDLRAPLEGSYDAVKSKRAGAVGRPSELKRLLGSSCDGTVFAAAMQLTSLACGVSTNTVRRLGVKNKFVHELLPRREKDPVEHEEAMEEATLRKYGVEWGPIVKWFIREKLKKDRMTVPALHKELCDTYADFPMSESTLRRFVKAIGVTFGRDRGLAYMLV